MLRGAGGLPRLVSTTSSKVLGLWSQCYSEGDGSSFCSPACPEFSSQQWLQLEPPTSKYSPELLKTNTKIQLLLLPTVLKTTVPQRGQPQNQGTKPTNLHALPYSGSLLSGLACSLNFPKENYQLLQLLSDLHISLQLSPVLVWNCCLAFWAVFPVAHEPVCREDLKSSHSKEQWGIRKGRRGETAVHSPEKQMKKRSFWRYRDYH